MHHPSLMHNLSAQSSRSLDGRPSQEKQQTLWQRRFDGQPHSQHSAREAQPRSRRDDMMVFSSLSDAMNRRKPSARRAPPLLNLSAVPRVSGPASAGMLNTFHGHPSHDNGARSLPNSPSLLSSTEYSGFPSPFSIPKLPLLADKSTSPSTRTVSFGSADVDFSKDHHRNHSSDAAQVATEVALSALGLEDVLEGEPSEMLLAVEESCQRSASSPVMTGTTHSPWEPESDDADFPQRTPMSDSAQQDFSAMREDQSRRKGRARMSQEKRRRLARRREREAAMLPSNVSALHPAGGRVPHSAPAHVTTFDSSAGWPTAGEASSPWWPAATMSTSDLQLMRQTPTRIRRTSVESVFSTMSTSAPSAAHSNRGSSFDFDRAQLPCSSPAPSLSPSGSSVGSPFERAFTDATHPGMQHNLHHSASSAARGPLDMWLPSPTLDKGFFERQSAPKSAGPMQAPYPLPGPHWTPAPQHRPRVIVQPPTPQDSAVLGSHHHHHFQHLSHHQASASAPTHSSELTSSKRLSQAMIAAETIVEGQEAVFQPPPMGSVGAGPRLLRSFP